MDAPFVVMRLGKVAAGTGTGGVRASCRPAAVWYRSGYASSVRGVPAGFEAWPGRLLLPREPRRPSLKEAPLGKRELCGLLDEKLEFVRL